MPTNATYPETMGIPYAQWTPLECYEHLKRCLPAFESGIFEPGWNLIDAGRLARLFHAAWLWMHREERDNRGICFTFFEGEWHWEGNCDVGVFKTEHHAIVAACLCEAGLAVPK